MKMTLNQNGKHMRKTNHERHLENETPEYKFTEEKARAIRK